MQETWLSRHVRAERPEIERSSTPNPLFFLSSCYETKSRWLMMREITGWTDHWYCTCIAWSPQVSRVREDFWWNSFRLLILRFFGRILVYENKVLLSVVTLHQLSLTVPVVLLTSLSGQPPWSHEMMIRRRIFFKVFLALKVGFVLDFSCKVCRRREIWVLGCRSRRGAFRETLQVKWIHDWHSSLWRPINFPDSSSAKVSSSWPFKKAFKTWAT